MSADKIALGVGVLIILTIAISMVVGKSNFSLPRMGGINFRPRNTGKNVVLLVAVLVGSAIWWFWDDIHTAYEPGYIFAIFIAIILLGAAALSRNTMIVRTGTLVMTLALVTIGYWGLAIKQEPAFAAETVLGVAMMNNINCDSPGPVSIGSRVTLSKEAGPCLTDIGQRVTLVPMDEKYFPITHGGAAIDWSNSNAPVLKQDAAVESIEYVIAPWSDTNTILTRNEHRQKALFRL